MIRVYNSTEKMHQMLKLYNFFQSFFINIHLFFDYFLIKKNPIHTSMLQ
jgi:hypothetical protein